MDKDKYSKLFEEIEKHRVYARHEAMNTKLVIGLQSNGFIKGVFRHPDKEDRIAFNFPAHIYDVQIIGAMMDPLDMYIVKPETETIQVAKLIMPALR